LHYNSGFYSNIARNYLRYGLAKTAFGQVITAGVVDPANFVYYTHHPPLLPLYVAASFLLFGVGEWQALIVPIAFSLGSVTLFHMLVKKYWGREIAAISTFVFILTPVFAFYGRQICYESPTLFFGLFILYHYLDWLESKKRSSYILVSTGFFMGVLTDWPILSLLPIISAHSLMFGEKASFRKTLLFWVFGLAAFGMFLTSLHKTIGSALTESSSLIRYYLYRANLSENSINYSGLFSLLWDYLLRGFTLLVIVPSAIWVTYLISRFRLKGGRLALKLNINESITILLLLFGLANIVFLTRAASENDYYLLYLTPFVALSAVLGLLEIKKRFSTSGSAKMLFWIFSAVLLIMFLFESYSLLKWLPYTIVNYWGPSFGLMLKDKTPADMGIMISFVVEPQVVYYADRYIVSTVDTIGKFNENINKPTITFRYLVMSSYERCSDLAVYLDRRYASSIYQGFVFYDLSSPL
jgi:4-amino-4-deoxy-L-arabinose transferase-like glycosyltransferase